MSTKYYIDAINLVSDKYKKRINKISIIGIYDSRKLNQIKEILSLKFPNHIIDLPDNSAKEDFKLIWNLMY